LAGSRKLPSLTWREVLKALKRFGFVPVRQSSSHILLRNREGQRIVVPRHDPVGKGLLMEILAEAGIDRDQLLESL